MKKTKKRLASILLTLVMAMTMFFAAPMTVYAATPAEYTLSSTGSTTYDSLAAAVNAAVATDTITLTYGDEDTLSATVSIGKAITLNLNGNSLTLVSDSTPAIQIQFGSLTVQGGTLIVNNTTQYGISVYTYPPPTPGGTSTLTVDGGATVNAIGGAAGIVVNGGGSTVNGAGTIIAEGGAYGVNALNGGKATVSSATGTDTGSSGASASGDGSTIKVKDDATSTGSSGLGAYAYNDGQIIVNGDATASGADGCGACAESGGQITVNGTASGEYAGALASGDGSTIEVTRNANGNNYGAIAENSGKITVGGNSTASSGVGACSETGGQITIDGTITAPTYVRVGSTNNTITQFALSSSKAGYIEYTDSTNFVWVKGYNSAANPHFGTFAGSGTVTGVSDLDEGDFLLLALNGVEVDGSNYDVESGSTIITLNEAYLKTFPNGTYTFRAFFNTTVGNFSGIAYTDLILTVNYPGAPEPDPNNPGGPVVDGPGGDVDTPGPGGSSGPGGGGANGVPQTSDVNNTLGWTVVLALVILGVFGLMAWRRKQRA